MENKDTHTHPIALTTDKISRIFSHMGFDTAYGPELDNEWYNFDALNVSKDHPARDMQDTFWIKDIKTKNKHNEQVGYVLRTHTSNVQIRTMEKVVSDMQNKIKDLGIENDQEKVSILKEEFFPIAICCPGKVFRNEATDATHEAQFHQVEGLYVAKDATLAMMIGVLQKFLTEFFESEEELKIRLRSSYFPFVEPGNEVDMQCFKCIGVGYIIKDAQEKSLGNRCSVCRGSGWIEIGGAGMVHPKVLENCGIDSREYRGFAFGCGMDRMAMLKWGIDDIRLLYNGDLRVIKQF